MYYSSFKKIIFPLLCCASATWLVTGCGGDSSSGQRPGGWGNTGRDPVSVELARATTSSISDQIRSFGTIRAQDVISIIPQVSNRVVQIYSDLGDSVRQGDVLARIYDVPFRDALEQAQAQLRQSRSTFERDSLSYVRQRQLFERNAISPNEYDNVRSAYLSSRAQYESAQAALTQSRENLNNTLIRSPVDGVVLDRMIAQGDLARTGEAVFEVANLTGYETRLFVPMHDWEAVRAGMPVELRLSNRDQIAAEGIVSRVSPQLNPVTGLGEIVVTLTDLSPAIRQGALVDARITLITHENTVVIPRSAMVDRVDTFINPETNTVEIQRNFGVFVAIGDTVAELRNLELGLEQGERVEVLSGLQAGEFMVITGQRNLSDGDFIRIAGQSPRAESRQRLHRDSAQIRDGQTPVGGASGNPNRPGRQNRQTNP